MSWLPGLLVALSFALVAVVWRHLAGSVSHPAVAFFGVWSAALGLASLMTGYLYPVTDEALLIYCLGGIAFAGGACLGLPLRAGGGRAPSCWSLFRCRYRRAIGLILTVVLWVCVAGIPLFLQRQIAAIGKGSLFLYRLRRYHLETQAEHLAQVNFLDNLVPLSLFVALLMVFEGSGTREGRFRRGAALVVALIYQVLTATRGSVVGFALMVGGIYLLKAKLAKLHHLVAVGSAALVLSMVLAFPLLKSGMEADESFLVNSARLTDDLVVYASGGLVAFGRVVSDPATIPPTRPVWAYFAFLLQKAGLTIATPALHASFVSIGPAHITNVYTMYFPYYCDFGYVGVLLFPVIFGCLATVCWGLARRGNPFGAVVFAGLIRAVVLSPYSEQLFLQLDWFIKNLLFTCVVYGVPFVLFTKSGQPEDTMSCE